MEEDNSKNLYKVENDKVLIEIALTTYNEYLKYKIINRYALELFFIYGKTKKTYSENLYYRELNRKIFTRFELDFNHSSNIQKDIQ